MLDDSLSPSSGPARIAIREAQASDVAALADLEARSFRSDRISRRRFAALARSASACLLVAMRGEHLVGYALVLTRRGSRSARLYSLAVAPDDTGQGIGRRLLAAAEAAALRRGSARLRLEVRNDNEPAIRLYRRAGYDLISQVHDYYEDGMTALRFGRDLRPGVAETAALTRAA